MQRFLKTVNLFGRSFAISALVGVLYLIAVEVTQYLLQYESTAAHTLVTFIIYLTGIALNYFLQRKVAFKSSNQPVVPFFLYNFFSAVVVSSVSGLIYSQPAFKEVFGHSIESASIVLSLLLISPITFLVFRHLFQEKSN